MNYAVCLLYLSMSKPAPYEVKCYMKVNEVQLENAKLTCALANKDPLSTCDAFKTSDGNRWFFVYQTP